MCISPLQEITVNVSNAVYVGQSRRAADIDIRVAQEERNRERP